MKKLVWLGVLVFPAISAAADLQVRAGVGHMRIPYVIGDTQTVGFGISNSVARGVTYGARIDAMQTDTSPYAEQSLGLSLGYRLPVIGAFYAEPFAGIDYLRYQKPARRYDVAWEDGDAARFGLGVSLGYRGRHWSAGLLAGQYLTTVDLADKFECASNCTSLVNIVYDPYAGMDAPTSEQEKALENYTAAMFFTAVSF